MLNAKGQAEFKSYLRGLEVTESGYLLLVGENDLNKKLSDITLPLGLIVQHHAQAEHAIRSQYNNDPVAIVSSYRLPDTDGLSFLSRAGNVWPYSIRVLLRPVTDHAWIDENAIRCNVSACFDSNISASTLGQYFSTIFSAKPSGSVSSTAIAMTEFLETPSNGDQY